MATDQSNSQVVILSGSATIYEASAIRDRLRDALAEGKNLRIDLSETGKWDLAGLQLLVSGVRTAHRLGLNVRLEGVPRNCREVAERSGLLAWLESVMD
jgi:ABC-type transporter Mla MlaB component